MLRLVVLGFISMLLFSSLGATQAAAQANDLPAVDAAGVMSPLAIDQLDSVERTTFESLPSGSEDARRFLYTRGYLRYCRLVVDGKLAPLELPMLPAQENWNRGFLSEQERSDILDAALAMKIMARMQPAVDGPGEMSPLEMDQLDSAERTIFESLPSGSEDARRFLYTRGYLRYCRLVVDGKLAPLELPPLPARENWNRGFLSEQEGSDIVDVALAMKLMAKMQPPAQ